LADFENFRPISRISGEEQQRMADDTDQPTGTPGDLYDHICKNIMAAARAGTDPQVLADAHIAAGSTALVELHGKRRASEELYVLALRLFAEALKEEVAPPTSTASH
jgi:hypothetical protein